MKLSDRINVLPETKKIADALAEEGVSDRAFDSLLLLLILDELKVLNRQVQELAKQPDPESPNKENPKDTEKLLDWICWTDEHGLTRNIMWMGDQAKDVDLRAAVVKLARAGINDP